MSTFDDGVVGLKKKKTSSSLRLALFLSLIGNILVLSNYNGTYWDDYGWLNQDFDVIKDGWEMAHGAAWVYGGGMFILASEFGIFPFRILFLIANVLVVLFCYRLLSEFKIFSKYDKVALCGFLSFVPYNEVGFFIITMPYVVSMSLFFGAFFLYVKWQQEITSSKRLIIVSIFFASFLTNSLVFFYSIFLIFLLLKNFDKSKKISDNAKNFVKHNYIFISLPALFLMARAVWFIPSGLYEGYNSFSATDLITAMPIALPELIDLNIFGLVANAVDELWRHWWIIIPLSLLIAVKIPQVPSKVKLSNHFIMILVGFTIFLIAAYPYLVAGHMPTLTGYNSRHQLLLPFGFSLMCYSLLSMIFYRASTRIKTIAISIVFLTFFSMKTDALIRYQLDWFYQQSIIENFRAEPKIENGSSFLYSTVGSKMIVRPIGFYPINALAKKAFGDDTRMIVFSFNISQQFDFEKFDFFKNYKQYNAHSWQKGAVTRFSIFDVSDVIIGDSRAQKIKYIFKMRFLEMFDSPKFNQEVKRLIALKFL